MKFLLKLLGIILVAAIVAVGALFFLPGERIARIAAEQLSAMTGRKVTMSGDTAISFYPVLGISTGKTTIANADWATGGPMLSADSLKLGVDPIALIKGDIKITGLEVTHPRIVLERAKDGRGNWQIGVDGIASSGQAKTGGAARANHLALTLDRALITDASVIYIDHATGARHEMANMDLDMRWPSYGGEADFDAVLRPAGQDVRITGRVDQLGPLIEGAVSPVRMTVSTKGGKLGIDGRASMAPQLGGTLDADIASTTQFLSALGVAVADIPKGLGQRITAKAKINVTDDLRLSLRDMVLGLDQNKLSGALDVTTNGARPSVTAQLSGDALDLTGLTGGTTGAGGGGKAQPATRGWSKAPIDASALGLVDANVSLAAQSLDLGQFKFGQTRLKLTIDRARAVVQLNQLAGYGGTVTGQVVANNRSGLSVGGDLKASGIDMERFLTDAAGITRFSTTGTASLNFLGVGQSVDAIMHSLSGSLSLATGRGKISGFDLDRLMRTGDGSGGTTVFDKMSASFDIKDGNMRNDDLTMAMPLATATGAGRIGLGARDIDYLFTPVLLEGAGGAGLAIPVRIRGPWADPSIRPDLEKAIDLNFKGEREKLEQKARDEVQGKLNNLARDKLGVQTQEGQSTEDAIKDKIEEKAAKELLKLFQ